MGSKWNPGFDIHNSSSWKTSTHWDVRVQLLKVAAFVSLNDTGKVVQLSIHGVL